MLFSDPFDTFHVCTTCGRLFQDLPDSEQPQRCKCHSDNDAPRWHGHDFNERASLCRCCGTAVLKSGSRWLVWFCDACMHDVVKLHNRHGGWIIPVGPHSLLHGILLPSQDARAIEDFSKAFGNLSQAIDLLSKWSNHQVIELIEALGFAKNPSVRLHNYLAYAKELASHNPRYSRDSVFAALCTTFDVPYKCS